jgi:hypothetical protein
MARAPFARAGGEAAREDPAVVRRQPDHFGEAFRCLSLPVRPDQQELSGRRAPRRAQRADDVGEHVGDLHHPVVALRHVGRRLDDDRLAPEVDKGHAVEGVVVGRDDDTLRRRQIVGDTAALVDRRARTDTEHETRPVLHQLPHPGAGGHVDRRIGPVVDEPRERLDIFFIRKLRRHAGRARQIGVRGAEGACYVRDFYVALRHCVRRCGEQVQDRNAREKHLPCAHGFLTFAFARRPSPQSRAIAAASLRSRSM